jgi:hypothetical protein
MRLTLVALVAFAARLPAADPGGWEELLPAAGGTDVWRKVDARWVRAADAALDPQRPTRIKPAGGPGAVWINGETGRLPDLVTKKAYTDVDVHVEFLLGKNSNSGIKFHAVYEIQLRDTAGNKGKLSGDDCGGIYPMAIDYFGYQHIDDGVPPRVNAARPAGEWQTLDVTFRSPQFDAAGKRTAKAEVVKAVLNGQLIHEHVQLKNQTGSNWDKKEEPSGPFMLQADHGPVAFRTVKIREIR